MLEFVFPVVLFRIEGNGNTHAYSYIRMRTTWMTKRLHQDINYGLERDCHIWFWGRILTSIVKVQQSSDESQGTATDWVVCLLACFPFHIGKGTIATWLYLESLFCISITRAWYGYCIRFYTISNKFPLMLLTFYKTECSRQQLIFFIFLNNFSLLL